MITLTKVISDLSNIPEDFTWTITLSDRKFYKLCKQFGTYHVSWYFTETGAIKYFDGENWRYEKNWE